MRRHFYKDMIANTIITLVAGSIIISALALIFLFFIGGPLQLMGLHPFWAFLIGPVLLGIALYSRRERKNEPD